MTASIAFDATDTDSGTIGSGGTYTFALTVANASGAERVVILAAISGTGVGNDFTACTIDGQTGTRLGSVVLGPDSGAKAHMTAYRAAGTANTSINVVATNGVQSSFSGYCACWKLSGADTVLATASSVVVDPTLSVDTASGGAVAAAALAFDTSGGATAAWTGLTEDFDHVQAFANDSFTGASANVVTGATPRTISVAQTPDPANSFAAIAISFNPAAAAGGAAKQMHHRNQLAAA
jgi:hypothetical protein